MHNVHLSPWLLLSLFLLALLGCQSTKELVVLLPGDTGQHGALTVGEGNRSTLLQTPLAGAKITAEGQITPHAFTQADIQQHFPHVLMPPPPSVPFTLYFMENSTELVPESKATLETLFAEVATRHQAVEVEITGHTDRMGSVTMNDRLSLERAQAVRNMLLERGLQSNFVRAVGRGEREPLVPTPDEQSEPRNRRVEILVR